MQWKRLMESKRVYEMRCREEVACNQFYHQEISRLGKSSKEAEKVSYYLKPLIIINIKLIRNQVFLNSFLSFQFQAHSKYVKARQSLDISESNYQSSVSSVEETRVAWEKETERSLAVFQSLEEERYALDLIFQNITQISVIIKEI